jgi:hypothetical protein
MSNVFRAAAFVLVLVPLASGCQLGMPRWDWWRSAQTGPPPGSGVAQNNAPKYPVLPSSTATPANVTASNGVTNPFPPGTTAPSTAAAPATASGTETATASNTVPASYPSTGAIGGYPSTAGSYAPQSGSYDANAYNAAAGAQQPSAHVATNINPYAPAGGYNPAAGANPAAGGNPTSNAPASYPNTEDLGGYTNAKASYGQPAAGAAPVSAGTNSYGTGSPVGDRYGAAATAPAATNYGAPANSAPAGTAYPPVNNYPSTEAAGGYRGSEVSTPAGATNYAAARSTNDRYPSYDQAGATAGPAASTADLRSNTTPTGTTYHDSAVTPASGGSYLPAGTKRLEGEMPTSPADSATPAAGSSTPYSYRAPGSMG